MDSCERSTEMIRIQLTTRDAELLREMLSSYHSELEMEAARTSRKEYREFLEKRDRFLEGFLQILTQGITASGSDGDRFTIHA